MITKRQQEALYALLDQASANGGTFEDLARRLGTPNRGHAQRLTAGLISRGLYTPAKGRKRPAFSAAAFKFIPASDLPAPDE